MKYLLGFKEVLLCYYIYYGVSSNYARIKFIHPNFISYLNR